MWLQRRSRSTGSPTGLPSGKLRFLMIVHKPGAFHQLPVAFLRAARNAPENDWIDDAVSSPGAFIKIDGEPEMIRQTTHAAPGRV